MTRRERLERKLEKREEWSGKARERAAQRFGTADRIADGIPMGQPILVGHHSEGRARRDHARIHSNMDKGVQESKLAEHHASKADGIEHMLDRSIFDDDPDAIEQLEARIAAREKAAEREKAINKAWRKGGAEGLLASGLVSAAFVEQCAKTMALCPWLKSPMSSTGTRAAIRKDRERIAFIQAKRARAEQAETAGGVLITGDDWVRVTFPEKPDREVLTALRAAGFYWGAGSWSGQRAKLPAIVLKLASAATETVREAWAEASEGLTPAFLVTCAVSQIDDAAVSAWVHSGDRRAHFERFAALALDRPEDRPLPPHALRDGVMREILDGYERRETG